MGVVTNEINIKKLQVGMEVLPVIMSSVQSMDLRIGAVEGAIEDMDTKTQITISPFNSRVGNVQKIYAFIRDGILFANFKWKQLVAATGADAVQAVLDGFEYDGASNAFVDGYDETAKAMKQYYVGKNTENKMVIRSVDTVSVDDVITFDLVLPIY